MDDASDPKVSETIRLHIYCVEEQNVTEIISIGRVILPYAFSFSFHCLPVTFSVFLSFYASMKTTLVDRNDNLYLTYAHTIF